MIDFLCRNISHICQQNGVKVNAKLLSKEQLKAEIDHQKEIFYMQHPTLSKKINE